MSSRNRDNGRGAAGDDVDRGGGRGGVAEIQRVRMVAALVDVSRERGMGEVTVSHIVARSGVSRRTFYELFADREDCLLAAFDMAIERAATSVLPAFGVGGSWRERVRAGLGALLEFLDDEPGLGALCIVDALGAGPAALARRKRVLEVLIAAVDEGRDEVRAGARPTRLTAEGVVGAVLAVLHARLSAGEADADAAHGDASRHGGRRSRGGSHSEAGSGSHGGSHSNGASSRSGRASQQMVALLSPLMGMIVLPYQGPAAAEREASRPAPRRQRAVQPQGDPLRELDMRLTYRTVRVLRAIAAHSGASNRRVADASGVSDEGQISKLLARLEHRGLIENGGTGAARGEPNVWRLTPKGHEVERTIRQRATPTGAEQQAASPEVRNQATPAGTGQRAVSAGGR